MLTHSFQTPKILGISCLNGFKFFIKRAFLVKFNLILVMILGC
ncbi:hypothetical protein HPHPA11_0241 [Helicobacter pylori Hp A-11]|uniref:Uncharacterized protein n=1 Tax=Helicobacter pylori Hp A-11 TaxID=992035 RepID=N4T7K1_HELPX|nr:hypothetical protein HPHPA11_0241 [Helicobacter pylori Hp A-11]